MKNNKSSPKQLVLFKNTQKRFFGGALLYKKRKSKRPISTREPLHLVFRSSFACGLNSFLNPRNKSKINLIIKRTADKYGVRIYQTALMSNHLHLIVLFPNRFSYHAFVSVISGLIARHVMRKLSYKQFVKHVGGGGPITKSGLKKEPRGLGQQFWDFRLFSRVLTWGRDYQWCVNYVKQNTLEALGFIKYKPRKAYYARWLQNTYPDISTA